MNRAVVDTVRHVVTDRVSDPVSSMRPLLELSVFDLADAAVALASLTAFVVQMAAGMTAAEPARVWAEMWPIVEPALKEA